MAGLEPGCVSKTDKMKAPELVHNLSHELGKLSVAAGLRNRMMKPILGPAEFDEYLVSSFAFQERCGLPDRGFPFGLECRAQIVGRGTLGSSRFQKLAQLIQL